MDEAIKRLANALRMAEKAHAEYEKRETEANRIEWPEFYAQWLIDNTHLWAHDCPDGKCEWHKHGAAK